MLVRLRDRDDWFDLWLSDKKNMVNTMFRNIAADLDAGYDPMGESIKRARRELRAYEARFEMELDAFKGMSDNDVNRWCYYDMVKRGAID